MSNQQSIVKAQAGLAAISKLLRDYPDLPVAFHLDASNRELLFLATHKRQLASIFGEREWTRELGVSFFNYVKTVNGVRLVISSAELAGGNRNGSSVTIAVSPEAIAEELL